MEKNITSSTTINDTYTNSVNKSTISTYETLTLIAIFLGPIIALTIQRILDNRRSRDDERMKIFKTLMSTRGSALRLNHVEALNMINVAFYGSNKNDLNVVTKWKEYRDHLNSCPTANDPSYEVKFQNWLEKMESNLTALLETMGKAVGFNFDALEIKKGYYSPVGHGELESEQTIIRKGLVDTT